MLLKALSRTVGAMTVSVLMLGLAGAERAFAETASTSSEATSGVLEEITVTARKREESAQNVPVVIAAISKEQIEHYDLTNLERLAAYTPEFSVGRAANGSGAELTLRGIGSSSTSIGLEQSVAVVVDGVYYGQGRTIDEGFFDLSHVEILKGPQALYFGKNATAGVVSIATNDPADHNELVSRASYEVISKNVTAEVMGTLRVNDDFGIRLALRVSDMFGGYFKNLATDQTVGFTDVATGAYTTSIAGNAHTELPGDRIVVGRMTMLWTPTSAVTASLKVSGDHDRNDNSAYDYVLYRCPGGYSHLDPSVACSTRNFDIYQSDMPPQLAAGGVPYAGDGEPYDLYESFGATASVDYRLNRVTITSITNYQHNENDFLQKGDAQEGPDATTWATEATTWRSYSTELRALTTFDGPVNAMVGGLYQNTRRKFDQWPVTGAAGVGVLWDSAAANPSNDYVAFSKDSATNGKTLSGFGQVTWTINPELEAAAGARYTDETKDSYFVHPFVNPAFAAVFVADKELTADQVFINWSPEATLTWKPTKDLTVYGAYKTAYKSGGFSNSGIYSALSPNPAHDFAFGPEKAHGFEAGIKSTLDDGHLRMNFDVYRYDYADLQVDFFNSAVFAFQTFNAGGALTKGAEFETEYAPPPLPGLTLRGSLNYNNARYTSFLAPCYAGETPAQGCTLTGAGGAPFQNLSGTTTAVAPEWTGLLAGTWDHAVYDNLKLAVGGDARLSSHYLASSFGNPYSRVGGYVELGASMRLHPDDDRWEVAVIGKNLSDRLYINGVVDGPSTGSGTGTSKGVFADQEGFAGLPRTVELQATVRF